MSAALQLPMVWEVADPKETGPQDRRGSGRKPVSSVAVRATAKTPSAEPLISLAFYRRHTVSMLRRYLYASMQVGRAPNILGDPVARGWASSRRIRTFEDAVIFVLDMETCINKLGSLDRAMISRVVLQEYTHTETAVLLGTSLRTVAYKLPMALDRLTEKLLEADLLVIPN